jgi:CRP-like cAMP-binding protein
MSNRVIENLRKAEVLSGLSDLQLSQVANICKAARITEDRTIFSEGEEGEELYVIHEGSVRVMINARDDRGEITPSTINTLYPGQCFGELVLLDGVLRSATVVANEQTILIVIRVPDFRALCDSNPQIGYTVMRNIAQDLAYKLRSANLLLRGDIRWRGDALGKG